MKQWKRLRRETAARMQKRQQYTKSIIELLDRLPVAAKKTADALVDLSRALSTCRDHFMSEAKHHLFELQTRSNQLVGATDGAIPRFRSPASLGLDPRSSRP